MTFPPNPAQSRADAIAARRKSPACTLCGGTSVVGHEVRGVYDGTLFWSCLDCARAWVREDFTGRRAELSASHVAAFNFGAEEATP